MSQEIRPIPKVLHYCWFGRGSKPHLIRKCLASWQKVMPDYEIKEWNEDNFDIEAIQFVKQAYEERKWAFVADVCRFYACYNDGGIYLDTDVEVLKRFDEFLKYNFFAGTEVRTTSNGFFTTLDASAFGCERAHWFAKECLDWYADKPFRLADGSIPGGVVQVVASKVLEAHGYKRVNEFQMIRDVAVFPNTVFTNVTTEYDRDKIFSLHHFDGSWTDSPSRGRFFKFCRRHDLMHWYRAIESMKNKLKGK